MDKSLGVEEGWRFESDGNVWRQFHSNGIFTRQGRQGDYERREGLGFTFRLRVFGRQTAFRRLLWPL